MENSLTKTTFFLSFFWGLDSSNFSITLANAEVLLEPNLDSTEETYKVTAVFEGKTLIYENCKPTLPIVKRLRVTVEQKPTHHRVNLSKGTLTGKDSILQTPY